VQRTERVEGLVGHVDGQLGTVTSFEAALVKFLLRGAQFGVTRVVVLQVLQASFELTLVALEGPLATGQDVLGLVLEGFGQRLEVFGAASNVAAQSQDGYAAGSLSNLRVEGDGTVNGVYTNGQTVPVGRLAVARFRANEGLAGAGHSLWVATRDSGEAALGAAGSGGRASVVAGALEQSNVDVSQQFVDLISHQRAFQASSKTITTADQMLQELMNINR
jgi:hypothetical protein